MEKSPDRNDPESSKSSTSSDQEVDQPADYVATGRSYECVFCKRGFTTAQALGGHMNIHRKDRAKNRPVGPVPISIHSNNHHHHQQINFHTTLVNNIHSHHPVSGYVPPQYNYYPYDAPAFREPQHDNYRTYFPASTSDGGSRIPQFGDDWRVNMSMQFGGLARGEGEEEDKGGDEEDEDEDDDDEELDLELRLGYNP